MSGFVLHLVRDHAAKIMDAAKARSPNECCGLLEGVRAGGEWRVLAVHEMPNIADDPSRHFLIDPQPHIRLLGRLRGTNHAVIGCFHSHPMGRAEPSMTDLKSAVEDDFVWLIAAGAPPHFDLRAYLFTSGTFTKLRIDIPE